MFIYRVFGRLVHTAQYRNKIAHVCSLPYIASVLLGGCREPAEPVPRFA
jgi:hypothetical protein